MSFGSLIGQDRVSELLCRIVEVDRVPHAVLLCGPEGSGKTAAAVSLARALQCTGEDRSNAPCDACENCHRTRSLSHPDMTVLLPFVGKEKKENQDERRKHTEEAVRSPYEYARPEPSAIIPIDPVRNLIRTFSYGSFQGSWRTAVVLHADKMGLEAANALLKTLEEPPAQSILILTAPSQKTVLPTIASRCQFFRLGPVSTPELAAYLEENRGTAPENSVYIAELSGGNIRLALTIASDEAHQTLDRALRFLTALLEGRDPQTFVALQQLASEKGDVFDVLKSAEVWLRDVLHFRLAGPEGIVNRHRLPDVEQLARVMTDDTIRVLADEIERVREMNRRNINLQISLMELWRRTRSTASVGSV